MHLKNSETEYGAVTKTFHWTLAFIVICLLAIGLTMDALPKNSVIRFTTYNLHKSFGIAVLGLILCRIVWHMISKKPHPVETIKPWEKVASVALHYGLYVLLLAMPLSGWLMSSAAGIHVHVFGLPALPDLIAADPSPDKNLEKYYRELHGDIGTVIMIVLGLHIVAALKHHFIDKDIVLKRMLPVMAFLMLALSTTPAAAEMREWNLIHEKSSITFRPRQLGTEFKGTFDTFSAIIRFDPDNPAASKAVIGIQIGTAHTGAADRDQNLKSKDWFDVAQFPDAKFETKSFRKTGPDSYVADGTLTIRNISLPVTLPFKLKIEAGPGKDTATADGTVTLDRSKFQIGTGQWADTGIIANEIPVDIHVVAIVSRPGK